MRAVIEPENLYAPPAAEEDAPGERDDRVEQRPASRRARLLAAAIDGAFTYAVLRGTSELALIAIGAGLPQAPENYVRDRLVLQLTGHGALLAVVLVQGALAARRGQSLGKMALRMRIVLADGRTAGLLRGFVVRTLPFWAILLAVRSILPWRIAETVGGGLVLLVLLDSLLILGVSRRCGHDRIAGTHVVRLAATPIAADEDEREPVRKRKKKKRRAPPA